MKAEATRDAILRAATEVFSLHGFDGGSIEKISSSAGTHDRMIYYYFGNKEGLFIAVLEAMYQQMDEAEATIRIDLEQPIEGLGKVIRFVLGYYRKHPQFITLLNSENLYKGKHIAKSKRASQYSSRAISIIDAILKSGIRKGLFREDLSPRDIYLLITATGYFYMSNRYTLSSFLGESLTGTKAIGQWEGFMIDSVLRIVQADGQSLSSQVKA